MLPYVLQEGAALSLTLNSDLQGTIVWLLLRYENDESLDAYEEVSDPDVSYIYLKSMYFKSLCVGMWIEIFIFKGRLFVFHSFISVKEPVTCYSTFMVNTACGM